MQETNTETIEVYNKRKKYEKRYMHPFGGKHSVKHDVEYHLNTRDAFDRIGEMERRLVEKK